MSTDYTDPATIDVDVVVSNINHAHRMRALVGGRSAAPTRDEIHDAIADALSEHVWAHGTGEIDGDGINEAVGAVVALLSRSAAEPPEFDSLPVLLPGEPVPEPDAPKEPGR